MKGSYPEFETKMEKSIGFMKEEFAAIRAGRANAAVLDKVMVEYYGTPTPVQQVGTISVPEPHMLVIQPWDASLVKAIEKAIQASEIGINPQNDGSVIRLTFPQLTEDRRKELVKDIKKMAEDSKVAIRSIRRDAIDKIKKMQKASEITEDDLKNGEDELQKITDEFVKEIDSAASVKEKEVMSI